MDYICTLGLGDIRVKQQLLKGLKKLKANSYELAFREQLEIDLALRITDILKL
ncbi:MAG: hypothetical protein ACK4UK_01915 [Flavobacterium sp.]